jgi:hypothetical protein
MLHTEIRYGLPMQALLLVFAGLSIIKIVWSLESRVWSQKKNGLQSSDA